MRLDKLIAQTAIRLGLLKAIESLEALRPNIIRILDYHRISDPEAESGDLDPSLISATPDGFDQQMRLLADKFTVLSLEDLLHAIATGNPLPPHSVMVTFDDGYRDFKTYAWPTLQAYKIPAILFVATDFLSTSHQGFWWDRLYHAITHTNQEHLSHESLGSWTLKTSGQRHQAFEEIKHILRQTNHHAAMAVLSEIFEILEVSLPEDNGLLTWQDVDGLRNQGLYVGAHTCSHASLSRILLQDAREEIRASQQAIRNRLGHAWPVFAYPSGHPDDLTPEIISFMETEGFQVGMTMIEGHNTLGRTSPFLLRRVGMTAHFSLEEFRLALTGVYDLFGTLLHIRASI